MYFTDDKPRLDKVQQDNAIRIIYGCDNRLFCQTEQIDYFMNLMKHNCSLEVIDMSKRAALFSLIRFSSSEQMKQQRILSGGNTKDTHNKMIKGNTNILIQCCQMKTKDPILQDAHSNRIATFCKHSQYDCDLIDIIIS